MRWGGNQTELPWPESGSAKKKRGMLWKHTSAIQTSCQVAAAPRVLNPRSVCASAPKASFILFN